MDSVKRARNDDIRASCVNTSDELLRLRSRKEPPPPPTSLLRCAAVLADDQLGTKPNDRFYRSFSSCYSSNRVTLLRSSGICFGTDHAITTRHHHYQLAILSLTQMSSMNRSQRQQQGSGEEENAKRIAAQ